MTNLWNQRGPQSGQEAGEREPGTYGSSVGGARSLAVGAMCACLMVVLALLGYYLSALSFIVSFLVAVPMVLAGLLCGGAMGGMSLAAAGFLLSIFINPISAFAIVLRYGLMGLVIGICFRRGYSGGRTFAVATMIAIVGIALGTMISFWIAGVPIGQGITQLMDAVTGVFDVLAEQEQMLALLPPGMTMAEYISFLKQTAAAILPAVFVVYCMLMVWANYLVSVFVLTRMGYSVARLPDFSHWQMPIPLLWLAMAGLALGTVGNYTDRVLLANISYNLLYMTVPLFLLSGFSVGYYYLQRQEIPQALKLAAIFFCFVFSMFSFFLFTVVGMFDAVLDWRHLHG